jgi:hypothetical protein
VTFKDLKKLVQQSQQEDTSKELFQRLQGRPFWIWNMEEHKQGDIRTNGDCCFNHIIGLPQKNIVEKPLYDLCYTCYYYSPSTVAIEASISGQSCATISGIFVLIQSAIDLSSDKFCDRIAIALVAFSLSAKCVSIS